MLDSFDTAIVIRNEYANRAAVLRLTNIPFSYPSIYYHFNLTGSRYSLSIKHAMAKQVYPFLHVILRVVSLFFSLLTAYNEQLHYLGSTLH